MKNKLKKIFKNITCVFALVAVFISSFFFLNVEIVKASVFSYSHKEVSDTGVVYADYSCTIQPLGCSDVTMYSVMARDSSFWGFYLISSSGSFDVKLSSVSSLDDSYNNQTLTSDSSNFFTVDIDEHTYYCFFYGFYTTISSYNTYFSSGSSHNYVLERSSYADKYGYFDNSKVVTTLITGRTLSDSDFSTDKSDTDSMRAESEAGTSSSNAISSDELGTLVDMEKHYRSFVEMGNSDSGSSVTERTHHWGWNKKTSSGLNLINSDSFDNIEVYCYLKVYDVSKKNWITGNKEKIESDKFKKMFFVGKGDASKLQLEIKQTHIWNDILTKEVKEIGDALGANDALHNLDYSYDFYFQLVGQKNGKYYKGDYIHFRKDGTAEEITGGKYDVSTNTASEDDNGDIKDNDDSKKGEGTTGTGDNYDDAKNNADSVANSVNNDSLDLESAKNYINQIASVPKMLAKIFSFFPDWVLYTFALGFALIPVLIIYKLIRG